jgi:predicted transporter
MSKISLRNGVVLFLAVFILPAVLAQPFRAELMAIVQQPALVSAINNLLGAAIITGLAIYAYNKRKRVQELEREVERTKYRAQNNLGD